MSELAIAGLPASPADVLKVPIEDVPDVIHGLIRRQALSPLMQRIHAKMQSEDPQCRVTGSKALRHLGFSE